MREVFAGGTYLWLGAVVISSRRAPEGCRAVGPECKVVRAFATGMRCCASLHRPGPPGAPGADALGGRR